MSLVLTEEVDYSPAARLVELNARQSALCTIRRQFQN